MGAALANERKEARRQRAELVQTALDSMASLRSHLTRTLIGLRDVEDSPLTSAAHGFYIQGNAPHHAASSSTSRAGEEALVSDLAAVAGVASGGCVDEDVHVRLHVPSHGPSTLLGVTATTSRSPSLPRIIRPSPARSLAHTRTPAVGVGVCANLTSVDLTPPDLTPSKRASGKAEPSQGHQAVSHHWSIPLVDGNLGRSESSPMLRAARAPGPRMLHGGRALRRPLEHSRSDRAGGHHLDGDGDGDGGGEIGIGQCESVPPARPVRTDSMAILGADAPQRTRPKL